MIKFKANQSSQLCQILINEQKQLKTLDTQYEKELNKLNDKHMQEWKEFESKEKRRALKDAESKDDTKERQAEEALLQRLQNL